MSWVGLSILAALIWAIVNILDKLTLTKWSIRPVLPVIAMSIVGLIASIGIFIVHPIPLLSPELLILAFISGGCYFATIYLYFYAVKWEDISRVIPLLYLTPLWIALIAHFFLNEHLLPYQYLGIALIIIGAILVSVKTFQAPRLNKALLAIGLSCLCFAINQVITKYLLEHTDSLTTFAYVRTSTFLASIPFLLINLKYFYQLCKESGLAPAGIIICNQSLSLIGLFIFISATSIGYVTLTNTLVAIQPFFVLVFASILSYFYPSLLKETFDKKSLLRKICATGFIFIGASLIQK